MKLELRSNIKLEYDYCFSRDSDLVFLRMYHTGYLRQNDYSRREMFRWLESIGIETVPNGLIGNLLKKFDPPNGIVVYLDEHAHMGDGKIWVSAKEAEHYKDYWGSVFLPPEGRAIRHFQFGVKSFTMPFISQNDWRCQKGQSHSWCIPGSRYNFFPKIISYPYFALDFIPGTDLVTDFQFTPGTTNDRLDTWMKPREMYKSLEEASKILVEQGTVLGSQERGFGLIWKKDLKDEEAWLKRIGPHLHKKEDHYE